MYLDIPESDGAGLSLSSEEMEEDEMFVVPVNPKIVIGGELGELPQVLLDFVHVSGGQQLRYGTLRVREQPPALEVPRHDISPHLNTSLPHPVPLTCTTQGQ